MEARFQFHCCTYGLMSADEAVSRLYDPWHPAVLTLVESVIREATEAGKDVSICGEMAGDPAFTALLLGLGLRQFSMHPSQISEVKQAVLRTDAAKAREKAAAGTA